LLIQPLGGGKMNQAAQENLVERIEIDGKTYLRYLPIPVDIALLKGSKADEAGNISLDEEPAKCRYLRNGSGSP
jgi:propionate CoA-transferase